MKALDKGIWIDERQAWIVFQKNKQIHLKTVESEVETYHLHGGSRSATPYGPQEVVSEPGLNRRKEQQLRKYFREVVNEILPAQRVYIAGPAEAKIGLEKELLKMRNLSLRSMVVEPADTMTRNQFVALVRKFFDDGPV